MMSYRRLSAMIFVSSIFMFGLMYLNTFVIEHIEFSQTRAWMAMLMGAAMAIIMMGFMWSMYADPGTNIVFIVLCFIMGAVALWLVRSQATVNDVAYMQAMIPHHSIAILTSERAQIHDPRVRHLADKIIRAQVQEIAEMKALISELKQHPPSQDAPILLSYRKKTESPLEGK